MQSLDALRQALDVQRTTAQGVLSTGAPAVSAPRAAAAPVDRLTISSRARALADAPVAAARPPFQGEPTDLEAVSIDLFA